MSHHQFKSSHASNALMSTGSALHATMSLVPHTFIFGSAPTVAGGSIATGGLVGGGTAATTGVVAVATVAAPFVLGAVAVGGIVYLLSR